MDAAVTGAATGAVLRRPLTRELFTPRGFSDVRPIDPVRIMLCSEAQPVNAVIVLLQWQGPGAHADIPATYAADVFSDVVNGGSADALRGTMNNSAIPARAAFARTGIPMRSIRPLEVGQAVESALPRQSGRP